MVEKKERQYVVDFLPGTGPSGGPELTVICKRSYRIDDVEGIAVPLPDEEQPSLRIQPEYFPPGDPAEASIRWDLDYVPFKPRVDVHIVGTGFAPHGKSVPEFEVSARIGAVERSLVLTGPRYALWRKQKKARKKGEIPPFVPPEFTDPEPIAQVPLRYELAFGGTVPLIPVDEEAYFETLEAQEEARAEAEAEKQETERQERIAVEKAQIEEARSAFFDERNVEDYFTTGAVRGAETEDDALSRIAGDGTRVLRSDSLPEEVSESPLEQDDSEIRPLTDETDSEEQVITASVLELHEEAQPLREGEARESSPTRGEHDLRNEGEIQVSPMWNPDGGPEVRRPEETDAEGEDDELANYPRIPYQGNPVGTGVFVSRDERVVEGLLLPQVEFPDARIEPEDLLQDFTEWGEEGPAPAGFGVVGPGWSSRAKYAGIRPEDRAEVEDARNKRLLELDPEEEEDRPEIQALLSQELPEFRPEWYNSASEDWQLDRLDGNEEMVFRNMTESGTLFFRMPGDRPVVTVQRGRGEELVSVRIDTCLVDVDERRVELVWRGHLPMENLDEIMSYRELSIQIGEGEWRETAHKPAPHRSDTAILDLDEFESVLDAEGNLRTEEGAQENPRQRDEEGVLVDRVDGDVVIAKDGWVEETLRSLVDEDEAERLRVQRTEREEREAQVEELRERMEEIAAEEAQSKKGKKRGK